MSPVAVSESRAPGRACSPARRGRPPHGWRRGPPPRTRLPEQEDGHHAGGQDTHAAILRPRRRPPRALDGDACLPQVAVSLADGADAPVDPREQRVARQTVVTVELDDGRPEALMMPGSGGATSSSRDAQERRSSCATSARSSVSSISSPAGRAQRVGHGEEAPQRSQWVPVTLRPGSLLTADQIGDGDLQDPSDRQEVAVPRRLPAPRDRSGTASARSVPPDGPAVAASVPGAVGRPGHVRRPRGLAK